MGYAQKLRRMISQSFVSRDAIILIERDERVGKSLLIREPCNAYYVIFPSSQPFGKRTSNAFADFGDQEFQFGRSGCRHSTPIHF
jgi:hypothetical protein